MISSPVFRTSRLGIVGASLLVLLATHVLHSEPACEETSRPATQPTTQPSKLPGIRHIDYKKKTIDLSAEVVLREADWLEQLACFPGTREHESILVIPARPSQIHFALLTLGLKSGSPMRWEWRDDVATVHPARGARVAVFIVIQRDGRSVEIPANEWVVHQVTNKPLADNIWLFAGSRLSVNDDDERPVYHADINGTTISLVNFGDDLLTRPTELTNMDDQAAWGAATEKIPKVGTKVVVRLKAVPEKPATTQPAGEKKVIGGSEESDQ